MTKPTTIYDREMNINAYTAQIKGSLKSTHTKSETLKIQNKYGLKSTIKLWQMVSCKATRSATGLISLQVDKSNF